MNVPLILHQAVAYCFHFCIRLLVTVPITLDQAVVTVPIILDQAVGYCSHYFASGC